MNPFGDPIEPVSTPPPAPLPPAVMAEIEKSVQQFTKRFGAMEILARTNGWIDDYRNELVRIARISRETTP